MARTEIQTTIKGRSLGLSNAGSLVINLFDKSQLVVSPQGLVYTDPSGVTSTISGGGTWSLITGTITNQADLMALLNAKAGTLTGGSGITVGGTTIAPTITNSGVRTLNAGTNTSVTGTATDPIVNATGVVTSVTGGTGITITGTAAVPIVTATASAPVWGGITGTLSTQTDLQTALNAKGAGTVTHVPGALTANALMIGNAAADSTVLASLGTTTTVLHGNAAGPPSFGAVSLTADVSGILPIANGGTGTTTPAIVAGTNVTVSGTWPNQTVNASAASGAPGGSTVAVTTGNLVSVTHNGNVLTAAATCVMTVVSGLATGFECLLLQTGSGLASFVAGGGVTLNAPNGLSTSGANTMLSLVWTAADTYTVFAQPTNDATLVNAASGATPAVNMALYNVVDLTLTAATVTPAFSGSVSGASFAVTLILRQDATGGRALVLPPTKWMSATAPTYTTTASAINVITLQTLDGGTSYLGYLGGTGFA